MGKRKPTNYEHKHTYNPKARESDERKHERLKSMEVRRMQNLVDKCKEQMSNYLPLSAKKKPKIDPLYDLKGAARQARETYRPPNYEEPVAPVDLLEQYKGRLWEHDEGKELLRAMLRLGIAQHGIGKQGKAAIKTFLEMLELDTADNICARHHLLRCYLDASDALSARQLLEQFPNDNYCCFSFTRALIEFISLSLEESGASHDLCNDLLGKAIESNPFAVWTLLYAPYFRDTVEHLDRLQTVAVEGFEASSEGGNKQLVSVRVGSVEDALRFFDVDSPVWEETEGAIEWCWQYVQDHQITPPEPALVSISTEGKQEDNECSGDVRNTDERSEKMYEGMWFTAMEMACEAEEKEDEEEQEEQEEEENAF